MAPSQLASRAFTAMVTASPSSTTVASTSLALAASSRPASLLGFAASAAAATAAVSLVSSSTALPDTARSTPSSNALQSILCELGLVSVAHCLELRDPAAYKVYNVKANTYSAQFTPMAVCQRAALNLAMVYAQASHVYIEVRVYKGAGCRVQGAGGEGFGFRVSRFRGQRARV